MWEVILFQSICLRLCPPPLPNVQSKTKSIPEFLILVSFVQVSKEELTKLVQGFEDRDLLIQNGLTLASVRYFYLSGTDKVIRAKLGKVGVHCMKTHQGKYFVSV